MRTAKKHTAALSLVFVATLLLCLGLLAGWLGAITPIAPIPSTDSGPEFVTDLNNALSLLQQNLTTLSTVATPQVLAPTITNLGSVSGSVTCNVAQSSGCQMTLAAPVTSFSISGGTPGQLITLQISQGSAGGASFAWPAAVQWQGAPPTVDPTPGASQLYELQSFDGVTWYPLVHSSLTGNAITGTGYLPAITNFNGIVQGALNVMAYGATGSTTSVTATTTSGSASVTLSSAGDFQNGQHVVLLHAGPATALSTPAAPIVKPLAEGTSAMSGGSPVYVILAAEKSGATCLTDSLGFTLSNANCTTSYTYQIVNVDSGRGMTAPSPATTITNGPAKLSAANRILVYWPQDPNAVETLVYGCSGSSCTPTLRAVIPANLSPGMTTYLNEFQSGLSGNYNLYWDIGGPYFATDEKLGTTLPTAATNQNLYTTIASGGGTTSLTLAASASVSGSEVMWHDDAPPIQSAIAAACGPFSPTYNSPATRVVYVPAGEYQLGSTLEVYNCPGMVLKCSSGNAGIGAAASCWLDWHGAGPMVDIEQSWGVEIDSFTVTGGDQGVSGYPHGSTPSEAFNIDNKTLSCTSTGGYALSGGGNGTCGSGFLAGDSLMINSSTDVIRNTFIGPAGVGVSWGATVNILNEKLQLDNVQMGIIYNSNLGGYIGLYESGSNTALNRVDNGMIANRTIGVLAQQGAGMLLDNLNYESDAIDVYLSDFWNATPNILLSEYRVYSENAQHHIYVANYTGAFGYHLSDSVVHPFATSLLPNYFYMILGGGGGQVEFSSSGISSELPVLIGMSSIAQTAPGVNNGALGVLTSINSQYANPAPFWPPPLIGSPSSRQWLVTSIGDTALVGGGCTGGGCGSNGVPLGSGGWITLPSLGFSQPPSFLNGVSALNLSSLAQVGGLSATQEGTPGSTTYEYWVAPVDAFGNIGQYSGPVSVTNGNATLSTTNYVSLSGGNVIGAASYYWWKNSTASPVWQVTVSPTIHDTGQAANGPAIAMPTASQQGVLTANALRNGCSGSVALASGTATVSNPCITGSRPILLMGLNDTNHVYVSAMSAGSVTIKSASGSDTATVYWSQN